MGPTQFPCLLCERVFSGEDYISLSWFFFLSFFFFTSVLSCNELPISRTATAYIPSKSREFEIMTMRVCKQNLNSIKERLRVFFKKRLYMNINIYI